MLLSDARIVSVTFESAVIENLTNYGGDNPSRTDVATFLFLTRNKSNQPPVSIETDNSDPLNVMEWEFLHSEDGVFEALMINVLVYDALEEVEINTLRYFDGEVYKALSTVTGNITNPALWEVVNIQDEFDNAESHVFVGLVIQIRAEDCYQKEVTKTGCGCDDKDIKRYERMALWLDQIAVHKVQQKFFKIEDTLREFDSYCQGKC
jgi:hypothetical protein